jgi:hypothetical protein
VKKSGTGIYGTKIPKFMVVTCTDPDDSDQIVDFVVPGADASLVASHFSESFGQ